MNPNSIQPPNAYSEARARVVDPMGLHARPAIRFVQLAASFDATCEVRLENSAWTNSHSLSKLMRLKIRKDTELYFRAKGQDATQVLTALTSFVEHGFIEQNIVEQGIALAQDDLDKVVKEEKSKVANGEIQLYCLSEGLVTGKAFYIEQSSLASYLESDNKPIENTFLEKDYFETVLSLVESELLEICKRNSVKQMVNGVDVGSSIIEFQIELLRDTELIQPMLQSIAQGVSAKDAWLKGLQQEINYYLSAEYLDIQSRSKDLEDLSKRVLKAMDKEHIETEIVDIEMPEGDVVLFAEQLFPSQLLELDFERIKGIVTKEGDYRSHVAMLARAYEIPFAVFKSDSTKSFVTFVEDVLAKDSHVVLSCYESQSELKIADAHKTDYRNPENNKYAEYLSNDALTSQGKRIKLYVNIDDEKLYKSLDSDYCDGIGLVRTEFLMQQEEILNSEEAQFEIYKDIALWAKGKPVTIRTLDAGGDKQIKGLIRKEHNPFLGLRGVRLSLHFLDTFRHQVRALLRVAALAELKVMFPMVSVVSEFEDARKVFIEELQHLKSKGVQVKMPSLGIMVETPAAALCAEDFDVSFYSVGTSDLTQYTFAADRNHSELSYLYKIDHPLILRLIKNVVDVAKAKNVEVSICGEALSQVEILESVLSTGIKSISIPINAIGKVKKSLETL